MISRNLEEEDCSICLEKMAKNDVVFQLPCRHVFHKKCVSSWIYEQKALCPNCRQGIYDDDEIVGVLLFVVIDVTNRTGKCRTAIKMSIDSSLHGVISISSVWLDNIAITATIG